MIDTLAFIDTLKELQHLYNTGELRNFDFDSKIRKYELDVDRFEKAMIEQNETFFGGTPFSYDPAREV